MITGSGDNAGKASFTLTVGTNGTNQTVLTIPYGAVLTLTEAGSDAYQTSVGIGEEEGEKGLSITLEAAQTVENLTVTFTNKEVHVAPTAYLNRKKLFRRLLLISLLLGSMAALPVWYRKRRNGGGDDEM